MKAGGMAGMHKMPDGTMMKDSEHKMAGSVKYNKGGPIRGYGMARGGKVCKMV
tara:strand:- start:271 stop:429 length:159 start_codon:yes stop_codon:yes gene_type:complete